MIGEVPVFQTGRRLICWGQGAIPKTTGGLMCHGLQRNGGQAVGVRCVGRRTGVRLERTGARKSRRAVSNFLLLWFALRSRGRDDVPLEGWSSLNLPSVSVKATFVAAKTSANDGDFAPALPPLPRQSVLMQPD